jgi:hypothetical protein
MPVPEECLNGWPEATFHNRVNLWQPLALKVRCDPSPVFLRLRQAARDLRLTRVEALAFQSSCVGITLVGHCAAPAIGSDRRGIFNRHPGAAIGLPYPFDGLAIGTLTASYCAWNF